MGVFNFTTAAGGVKRAAENDFLEHRKKILRSNKMFEPVPFTGSVTPRRFDKINVDLTGKSLLTLMGISGMDAFMNPRSLDSIFRDILIPACSTDKLNVTVSRSVGGGNRPPTKWTIDAKFDFGSRLYFGPSEITKGSHETGIKYNAGGNVVPPQPITKNSPFGTPAARFIVGTDVYRSSFAATETIDSLEESNKLVFCGDYGKYTEHYSLMANAQSYYDAPVAFASRKTLYSKTTLGNLYLGLLTQDAAMLKAVQFSEVELKYLTSLLYTEGGYWEDPSRASEMIKKKLALFHTFVLSGSVAEYGFALNNSTKKIKQLKPLVDKFGLDKVVYVGMP